jgi:hypothetical protein
MSEDTDMTATAETRKAGCTPRGSAAVLSGGFRPAAMVR